MLRPPTPDIGRRCRPPHCSATPTRSRWSLPNHSPPLCRARPTVSHPVAGGGVEPPQRWNHSPASSAQLMALLAPLASPHDSPTTIPTRILPPKSGPAPLEPLSAPPALYPVSRQSTKRGGGTRSTGEGASGRLLPMPPLAYLPVPCRALAGCRSTPERRTRRRRGVGESRRPWPLLREEFGAEKRPGNPMLYAIIAVAGPKRHKFSKTRENPHEASLRGEGRRAHAGAPPKPRGTPRKARSLSRGSTRTEPEVCSSAPPPPPPPFQQPK